MSNQDIEDPSPQVIQQYRARLDQVNNPFSSSLKWKVAKDTTFFALWFGALFGSIIWQTNPQGSNRRIQYEKSLSPAMRYSRKYLPLGILVSGLAYWDICNGIF